MALVLLLAVPSLAERITFRTDDGIEIVGDYVKGKPGAPGIVCIPMYLHTRQTYLPLVIALKEKGFHVLAIDTRGHGESAPDLAPRAKARDAKLFNAMHLDVMAAMRALEERGADRTRIGLVGGSVGCSVAIDTTVRARHAVRAVVLLTPGSNYLGVDSLQHLKKWPGTAVFTLTSKEEQAKSKGVMDALKPFDASNHFVVPRADIHGTRMFNKVPGIEELIANWMFAHIGDLRVPQWKAGSPAPGQPGFFGNVMKPTRRVGKLNYTLMAWSVGDEWSFGGLVDGTFQGKLRIRIGDGWTELPFDTKNVGAAQKQGDLEWSQASFRGKHWIVFSKKGLKNPVKIALEFKHGRGKSVRLPAQGTFFGQLQPVKE